MNVKVEELKGKLAKSNRRTMMLAIICGDDRFVAKILKEEPAKVFELIDKWADHWADTTDEEIFGDIANNAVVALKELGNKGKDSTERAAIFLDAFTSLSFESKDEITLDDRCNAVVQLRLIQKLVLPSEMVTDYRGSRKNNSKIKNFTPNNKDGAKPEPETVVTIFRKCLDTAQKEVGKADNEEAKKKLDKSEANCAKQILKVCKGNKDLAKAMVSFAPKFADWIAEQIYGLKPEVVEAITTIDDEKKLAIHLFDQYIKWLKGVDPNGYVDYLAESTKDDGKGNKKGCNNCTAVKKQGTEDDKEESVEVYGERPCVLPFDGTIGVSIEGDVSIVGSYAWRQDRLAKIRERRAAEEAKKETKKATDEGSDEKKAANA